MYKSISMTGAVVPKKLRPAEAVPTLVVNRLRTWGRSIRAQRVRQRIPAADLCLRMDISDATLRRIERGDPGASAATYLTALWILGIFEIAAPPLAPHYWDSDPNARASTVSPIDDDYF